MGKEELLERARIIQDCELWPYEGDVVDLSKCAPNKKHVEVLSRLMSMVTAIEWYTVKEREDVTLENVVEIMAQQTKNHIDLLSVIDEIKGSIEDCPHLELPM